MAGFACALLYCLSHKQTHRHAHKNGCFLCWADALGSTAFAPVKSDIAGNIKKIRGWHAKDEQGTATLQALVQKEMDAGTTKASGSATDALLWLKRYDYCVRACVCVCLQEDKRAANNAQAHMHTCTH